MSRPLNDCQFGHGSHLTKQMDGWVIWDWEEYWELPPGWCPARDDVSRTLDLTGTWEPSEFARCMSVIRRGDVVIDFGSHIGWYTIGAAMRGAIVYAFDACDENMRLCELNLEGFGLDAQVETHVSWVEDLPPWPVSDDVRLVKADVEGSEGEVVRVLRPLLEARRIDHLMLEVSPEFGDVGFVDELRGFGFRTLVDGEELTGLPASQTNVWFERV